MSSLYQRHVFEFLHLQGEAYFMKLLLRNLSLFRFIVCFLLLAPLSSLAQTSLGILVGVVRDQTGAVVSKVTVTVTGNEDGIVRTVITQGDGAYRIESGSLHYTSVQ